MFIQLPILQASFGRVDPGIYQPNGLIGGLHLKVKNASTVCKINQGFINSGPNLDVKEQDARPGHSPFEKRLDRYCKDSYDRNP